MKSLLITTEYPPFHGGVGNYYYYLVNNFPEKIEVMDNSSLELDSNQGRFSWLIGIKNVFRKIRRDKINHVLVGQILPLGTIAFILSLILPFKYSVFLHGLDFSLAIKTRRKKILSKMILRRASHIISANSFTASELIKKFPKLERKLELVNPGVSECQLTSLDQDREKIKAKYNIFDKVTFFSLARLVARKGFDNVILALDSMSDDELSGIEYFIAGQGEYLSQLKSMLSERLKNVVFFLGSISEAEKWAWLSLSDVFIMPSRNIAGDYEGFGIVYLEANLMSKPVIAGNSGGVKDAVVDGLNGLLLDPQNIESIKGAMLKLKNNSALRTELGQRGRIRAINDFNWPKLSAKIFEIINKK